MTLKELRVKKIDLGHDDENSDEWWDLDGQIQQLKKKITSDKYSNLDMGKITEEKMKTALDIQDDKISDKQKGRIESHFERNKEAIEKSEFGNFAALEKISLFGQNLHLCILFIIFLVEF